MNPPSDPDALQQPSRKPARLPSDLLAWLLPNHRDLYVLVAGLIAGVLLSPAVLGQLSPDTYQKWFPSYEAATVKLAAHDVEVSQVLAKLASTDVTSVALEEFEMAQQDDRMPLVRAVHAAQMANGRVVACMLAVVFLMILETLPAATSLAARSRLATARYAVTALLLALILAQPWWIGGVSIGFLLLIVAAGLVTAMVPLGGRGAKA